jgi:hypothetical protein
MNSTQRNIIAVAAAAILGMTVAHCSGCALFVPEGEMTMEVSDE